MMRTLKKLLGRTKHSSATPTSSAPPRPDARRAGKASTQNAQPENVELVPMVAGRLSSNGPGKNVLIRNHGRQEDVAAAEKPSIVDEPGAELDAGAGIDPYNSGNFDRSKNWDKRFRK